jgi:hypothetical protein
MTAISQTKKQLRVLMKPTNLASVYARTREPETR